MPSFNVWDDLGVKGYEAWKEGKHVGSFMFDESVMLIN